MRGLIKFFERQGWPHVKPHYDWAIGIYEGVSPLTLRPLQNLTNPVLTARDVSDVKAEFVADPFVVRHDDSWHMFFEVMNSTTARGEIGWAISDDHRAWHYQRVVLRETFHVSYPFVFQFKGDWYMIPESTEAAGLSLYRADSFPTGWQYSTTLLTGEFADHALVRHADIWWLFVGKNCESGLQSSDTLELYFADDLQGPWQAHPQSPVIRKEPRFSRPAGRVISTTSGLLRVAQDCSTRYGRQVNAALIETMTKTSYRETLIERPLLVPGAEAWHRRGMHHLDAHEISPNTWLAAVDGYRRRFSFHLR